MRRGWFLPVALAGCGTYHFDLQPDAAPAPPDAPLPALVCSASRTLLEPAGPGADLAIAATSGGFVVAWTSGPASPLYVARLDDMRRVIAGPTRVADGPFDGVAGITDLGTAFGVVTVAGANQTLRSLSRELAGVEVRRSEAMVASREPIASGGGVRALLRATDTRIAMSYVFEDGRLGNDAFFDTGRPVTAVAGDDGPGHGHISWVQANAGASECVAADVKYDDPQAPAIVSNYFLSDDCYEIRNANGPLPADSMLIAWRTKSRSVLAKYIAGSGDKDVTVSTSGRAPRVRFDGTSRFWAAWIDEDRSPEQLRVGWIDLEGAIERSALDAWTPAGDEAFELVRNGLWTYLAVLGADGALDVLALCN